VECNSRLSQESEAKPATMSIDALQKTLKDSHNLQNYQFSKE